MRANVLVVMSSSSWQDPDDATVWTDPDVRSVWRAKNGPPLVPDTLDDETHFSMDLDIEHGCQWVDDEWVGQAINEGDVSKDEASKMWRTFSSENIMQARCLRPIYAR